MKKQLEQTRNNKFNHLKWHWLKKKTTKCRPISSLLRMERKSFSMCKNENLRLWLTANVGVSLRFREKLIQPLVESTEKMIDEKNVVHPTRKRNRVLRLPIQRSKFLQNEQIIPVVVLCGWLFCGLRRLLDALKVRVVWREQQKNWCINFIRWWRYNSKQTY